MHHQLHPLHHLLFTLHCNIASQTTPLIKAQSVINLHGTWHLALFLLTWAGNGLPVVLPPCVVLLPSSRVGAVLTLGMRKGGGAGKAFIPCPSSHQAPEEEPLVWLPSGNCTWKYSSSLSFGWVLATPPHTSQPAGGKQRSPTENMMPS